VVLRNRTRAGLEFITMDWVWDPRRSLTNESDTECGIMAIVASLTTIQKMRKNRMGWRIEELQAVAEENLVEWRRPGRGGSHVIFSAPGVREIVSVPAKRPIKPVYIKQFVALIDAAGGISKSENNFESKS
jgi:hypothetical protein